MNRLNQIFIDKFKQSLAEIKPEVKEADWLEVRSRLEKNRKKRGLLLFIILPVLTIGAALFYGIHSHFSKPAYLNHQPVSSFATQARSTFHNETSTNHKGSSKAYIYKKNVLGNKISTSNEGTLNAKVKQNINSPGLPSSSITFAAHSSENTIPQKEAGPINNAGSLVMNNERHIPQKSSSRIANNISAREGNNSVQLTKNLAGASASAEIQDSGSLATKSSIENKKDTVAQVDTSKHKGELASEKPAMPALVYPAPSKEPARYFYIGLSGTTLCLNHSGLTDAQADAFIKKSGYPGTYSIEIKRVFLAGFSAGYMVSKHIGIQGGCFITRVNEAYDYKIQYDSSSRLSTSPVPVKYHVNVQYPGTNTSWYIYFPLQLKYTVPLNKYINIKTTGGGSYMALASAQGKIPAINFSSMQDINSMNYLYKNNFSLLISEGLDFHLSRKFELGITVSCEHFLQPMFTRLTEKYNYTTAGAGAELIYNFR